LDQELTGPVLEPGFAKKKKKQGGCTVTARKGGGDNYAKQKLEAKIGWDWSRGLKTPAKIVVDCTFRPKKNKAKCEGRWAKGSQRNGDMGGGVYGGE